MNRPSAEAAVAIDPAPGGGVWEWYDSGRHLKFRPAGDLQAETIYTVDVGRLAQDEEGRFLATAASWNFETAAGPSSAPGGGSGLAGFRLAAAAPNPFHDETQIAFALPRRGRTRVALYDIRGRLVATLLDESLPPGIHTVRWDGHDMAGHQAAAGIYFCRLQCGGLKAVRKIILSR
jgi:hypothetical protein